jgi:hypothetical protein
MRRVLLGGLVLFFAACGGGARSDVRSADARRNPIPTDRETAVLIESLIATFGEDAVDTCLAAFQDARDVHLLGNEQIYRPDSPFRSYMSECLGAQKPAASPSQSEPGGGLRRPVVGGR